MCYTIHIRSTIRRPGPGCFPAKIHFITCPVGVRVDGSFEHVLPSSSRLVLKPPGAASAMSASLAAASVEEHSCSSWPQGERRGNCYDNRI